MNGTTTTDTLTHANAIVVAYLVRHDVPRAEFPMLISDVRAALEGEATTAGAAPAPKQRKPSRWSRRTARRSTDDPAVPIAESVTPDYIVSLETGQRFKVLERHVRSSGMCARSASRRRATADAGACRRIIRWPRRTMRRFGAGSVGRWGGGSSSSSQHLN